MFKKISCFLLAAALLALPAVAAPAEDAAYFKADFNDNELPKKTDVTFGEDGFIYADDGMMIFEASYTYPPVTTALFPYASKGGDFFFECDVKLESHLSENSWFSLCFGAENEDHLYQFSVSVGGEVSMKRKNGASSWKTLCSVSLGSLYGYGGEDGAPANGGVADDTGMHLGVAVTGGAAYGFIDGIPACECRVENNARGYVGVNGRGVRFTVDDLRVGPSVPAEAGGAGSFGAELYQPATGAASVPLLVERDRNNIPLYTAESKRPGAVMMTVKAAGGTLRCYDGTTDLGEIGERLEKLGGLMLPAFYVTDDVSAELLAEYVAENSVNDAFVIFSRTPYAELFRDKGLIRRVVDLSSRDMIDVAETYRLLYSNGLRTVMLSESAADADTVYELHKRLISVWVVTQAGALPAFDAAVKGADALVTPDPADVINTFESMTSDTVIRRGVKISDGGNTSAAPANTFKSILSAAESGFDTINVSVMLTKDGVPVLSSSDKLTGMSSDLTVSESTLASLQTLSYNDPKMSRTDRITSLEELFEKFSRERLDVVFHVRVTDRAAAEAVCEKSAEYGMTERCVIVSSDAYALKAAMERGTAAAYCGGPYSFDGRDADAALYSVCRILASFNSAYYADVTGTPDDFASVMRAHGFGVYAAENSGGDFADPLSVYDGCAVSDAKTLSGLPFCLKAETDADGRLSAKLRYCGGAEIDVTALCTVAVSDGDVVLSGGTVTGSGRFAVLCPQTAADGGKYLICSELMHLTAEKSDTVTDGVSEASSNGTLTAIIVSAAAAVIAGGLVVLGVLNRKKRRETAE